MGTIIYLLASQMLLRVVGSVLLSNLTVFSLQVQYIYERTSKYDLTWYM